MFCAYRFYHSFNKGLTLLQLEEKDLKIKATMKIEELVLQTTEPMRLNYLLNLHQKA